MPSVSVGANDAALSALKDIITDLRCCVHRLLDIAGLEAAEAAGCAGPDSRIAIRLKLYPHANGVGFSLLNLTTQRIRLAKDAEFILDVMSDFMGNYISGRKVSPAPS